MYYLGVDLGGTNIAVGIVNETGYLMRKLSVPTNAERGCEAVLEDIAGLCLQILHVHGIDLNEIHSIGIGSPGTVDNNKGFIVYANNIKFKNTPIRKIIQKYIDLPVFLTNDANAAAFAEHCSGAAKGYTNSITITLGTGIGGGIIIGGRILSGSFEGGGEVGHHVIVLNGEQCTCGRKGCWEVYASATGLIRHTKIAAARHPESSILKFVNGNLNAINAKVAFDAAKSGDITAQAVINNYLIYIAEGVINLINIFQPEIIVFGGGISAQGDTILEPINAIVSERIYGGDMKTKLSIAQLGNDAGIIGSALLGTIF